MVSPTLTLTFHASASKYKSQSHYEPVWQTSQCCDEKTNNQVDLQQTTKIIKQLLEQLVLLVRQLDESYGEGSRNRELQSCKQLVKCQIYCSIFSHTSTANSLSCPAGCLPPDPIRTPEPRPLLGAQFLLLLLLPPRFTVQLSGLVAAWDWPLLSAHLL